MLHYYIRKEIVMYENSIISFIIFRTRKYRLFIFIAAVLTLVIFVKRADHQSSSNASAIINVMQTYVSPYPSFNRLKDANAFLSALGAKDRNPALHYNWTIYSSDTLNDIRIFYKNDLTERGYTITKTTANRYLSEKGKLRVRISFAEREDDERMISIIIYDTDSLH